MYQFLFKNIFFQLNYYVLNSKTQPQSSIGDEVFTITDNDERIFAGDWTGCVFGKYSSIEGSMK